MKECIFDIHWYTIYLFAKLAVELESGCGKSSLHSNSIHVYACFANLKESFAKLHGGIALRVTSF